MQESVCPECGAHIGGGQHILRAGNAGAPELEDMNPNVGADPWRWAENNGRYPWDR
jgi:hypothetical protein